MKFDIKRFKTVLLREFYTDFLPAIKIMGVIVVIILLLSSINVFFGADDSNAEVIVNFGIFLFIAGVIYTSLVFGELKSVQGRAAYLSLPASHFEKLLSKWISTNPAFIMAISLLFLILSLILSPLWTMWGSHLSNEIFTSANYWKIVGHYFIIHSIFFLGSIAFNKNSLFKTLVALLLFAVLTGFINLLFFRIVWYDYFDGLWMVKNMEGSASFGSYLENPEEIPQVKIIIFLFHYVMAPVLWVVSFFKLIEKEV